MLQHSAKLPREWEDEAAEVRVEHLNLKAMITAAKQPLAWFTSKHSLPHLCHCHKILLATGKMLLDSSQLHH